MGFNLAEFKERVSIVKVIENFIPVQKQGFLYKALCPFHSEKTPSLVINEEKGFFHCFGCNESGDAIAFVEKLEKVDFKEALARVAKLENIELLFNKNQGFFNEALQGLKLMQEFFKFSLENNEKAKKYLYKRGLNEADFLTFSLGFVPSKERFINFLKEKNLIKLALNLGYLSKDKIGNFHCIYANRLSFAFKDSYGKIRGFSTREFIKNEKLAKYINSKNTELFDKSFLLFNLSLAKSTISKQNEVFITEGFFDAMSLYKLGFKNAVASSGTAFAKTHLALLLKQSKDKALNFIFVPDKDEAGYKAVIRSLKLCLDNHIFTLKVAILKAKVKDLGEFYEGLEDKSENENDTQKEAFLNSHFLLFDGYEFYLKYHLKRLKTSTEKDAFLKETKDFLRGIKSFFVKNELINKAAEVFKIPTAILHTKELKQALKQDENLLLKRILKTALKDESFRMSFEYFVPSFLLMNFENDYKNFKKTKELNEKLLILLSDENIKELKSTQFSLALKAFLKNHYQKELLKAVGAKDSKRAYELSAKIKEIGSPF